MRLGLLYLATLVIFLGLDAIGLTLIVQPVFQAAIGPLLLEDFRLLPAGIFYAFYVAVLLYFVSWPAMRHQHSLFWALGNGALMGAFAYGTYEFTSFAVMADWTWGMVVTDLIWGTCLTALSVTGGLFIARRLT